MINACMYACMQMTYSIRIHAKAFPSSSVELSIQHILTNCPAFRGTVLIFGPKFAAVLLFFSLSHFFLLVFGH